MKVIICGSREWTDEIPIRDVVNALPAGTTVITGGARGADRIATKYATQRGDLPVKVFFPDWETHGKAAGPIRNRQMLAFGAELVIAFRLEGTSRGTDDMVRQAEKAGVPVEVFSRDAEEDKYMRLYRAITSAMTTYEAAS